MKESRPLPGLERLMSVCQGLGLRWITDAPGHAPPEAGMLVGGHPLDPVLAAVYARVGAASFATDMAGFTLARCDDSENVLESRNQWWRGSLWQQQLPVPLFIFASEPLLSHYYATVPSLADDRGVQPVVHVVAYDVPYALPVASDVDRLFDVYSRYLEALVAHPDYEGQGDAALVFPWDVPELLARDERLVALIRAGIFDSLMPREESTRAWVARVVGARE
jgi:hypothetical protein